MNLSREQSYLRLFQQVTSAITSTLDVDEVLQLIVRKVPQVVGVDAATIRLLEPGAKKLRLLASHGLSEEYLNRGPVDAESSVTTALAGTPVAIFDATRDDRMHYSDAASMEGIKSILVAPIPIRGRIQGVLRLLTRSPRQFDGSEIEFVSALAEQCGIAIENAVSYNKISNLVTELEQQEEFLQQVIDNLNADLFVLDNDFRIIMANRVFLKNHNVKEKDIIGRPCHQVLRVGKEGEHPVKRVIEENRRVIYTQQIEKGGREVYLEVMASPVSIYQEGKTDFIIGTIRDISDHIHLQKEQAARERLQGVLEMAGAAAHELNSPLFSALGTSQLALEDIKAGSPLHTEMTTIERNLKVMSELLRKMGRITRYKSKAYVGDTSIVDIGRACADPFTET